MRRFSFLLSLLVASACVGTAPASMAQGSAALDAARAALERGDWAAAKTQLDPLVQRREPRALVLLADLHYPVGGTGGFAEDPDTACSLYERATVANLGDALFGLARCFADGRGRPQDAQEARALFDRATQRGSARAWCALGRLSFDGIGGPVDPATGIAMCRQGSAVGDADADLELGLRYLEGRGVPKSFGDARAWLDRAAQRGSPRASLALAEAYAKGNGVPRDRAQAARFLEQAARAGDLDAAQQLVNGRVNALLDATAPKEQVVDSIYWLTMISRFHPDARRRELATHDVEDLRRRFAPYTMDADFRIEKEPYRPVLLR